jgi:hypothetical protein
MIKFSFKKVQICNMFKNLNWVQIRLNSSFVCSIMQVGSLELKRSNRYALGVSWILLLLNPLHTQYVFFGEILNGFGQWKIK